MNGGSISGTGNAIALAGGDVAAGMNRITLNGDTISIINQLGSLITEVGPDINIINVIGALVTLLGPVIAITNSEGASIIEVGPHVNIST